VAFVVPPVPAIRLDWGEAWHAEWVRAHRAMAPWDRVPSVHLIDDAVGRPDRRWVSFLYDVFAATSHMPSGEPQADGGFRWHRGVVRPDTLKRVNIRVVLGSDGHTIATSFQVRHADPHR
jgi:hypothetical protein